MLGFMLIRASAPGRTAKRATAAFRIGCSRRAGRRCARMRRFTCLTYTGFTHKVARQLEGLLWKDGGPVIGIQLENELADNPGIS